MRRLMFTLLLVLAVVGVSAQEKPAAKPDAPALTEVQRLKADNFKLKVEVAQLRATVADRESRLASVDLSAEQAKLAAEFLQAVNAMPGSTWDWAEMKPVQPAIADTPPELPSAKMPIAPKGKE